MKTKWSVCQERILTPHAVFEWKMKEDLVPGFGPRPFVVGPPGHPDIGRWAPSFLRVRNRTTKSGWNASWTTRAGAVAAWKRTLRENLKALERKTSTIRKLLGTKGLRPDVSKKPETGRLVPAPFPVVPSKDVET